MVPGSSSNSRSNGFYCSSSNTRAQDQGMDISELELVQIIIILLVMTLVVVMIICLLSHYWLPALALLSRFSHSQREQATQTVLHGRFHSNLPPFMQQQQRRQWGQQLYGLQPTFPYLQQEVINLPPIICLSDGEERLPYKGPCSLQLRDAEQQLEVRRATVRAPPNRTVFDIDLIDIYARRKEPGSSKHISVQLEDPPPSYSEVMLDYSSSTDSNNMAPTGCRSQRDSTDPESTTCTGSHS